MKWVKSIRKQWSDAINDIIKQTIIRQWTEETKVSPNVKDVVCHLISTNNWENNDVHFLQESQVFLSP